MKCMRKKTTGPERGKMYINPVKRVGLMIILLTGNFYLLRAQFSVDAQYRNRFEVRNGYKGLAPADRVPAVFISQRTRISVAYETSQLRVRFTPQDVRVWGDEQLSSSTGVFGNPSSLDLFEAFLEIKTGTTGWLSVGRQQLVYDNQRILATRNWNQNGIAYDAVVYKWQPEGWKIHMGGSWNSTGQNSGNNFYDPSRIKSLNFLWVNRTLKAGWDLSLSHVASGTTKSANENRLYFRHTTGLFTTYKAGRVNAMANGYLQSGKNQNGEKVRACLLDVEASYRVGLLTPGVGISYLSGNSNTETGRNADHLFDVLYGGRHKFFGGMDYFTNIGPNTNQGGLADCYYFLDLTFSEKINLKNAGHYFRLAKNNSFTPDDKNLGYENDLVLKYRFTGWGALEWGYLFFLPMASLKTIQGVADPGFSHFLYLQLTATPSLFKN